MAKDNKGAPPDMGDLSDVSAPPLPPNCHDSLWDKLLLN